MDIKKHALPTALFLILTTGSIHSSAVVLAYTDEFDTELKPITYDRKQIGTDSPEEEEWVKLVEQERYQEAIEFLDVLFPENVDWAHFFSCNHAQLILVMMGRWNTLFYNASIFGKVEICQAIWERRSRAAAVGLEDALAYLGGKSIHRAVLRGDTAYLRWAMGILKEAGLLGTLNDRGRHYLKYQLNKFDPKSKRVIKGLMQEARSCLEAAEDIGHKDICTILLQYGVDPLIVRGSEEIAKGVKDTTSLCPVVRDNQYKDISRLVKGFFYFKPHIIEAISSSKIGANSDQANRQLRAARWALWQSPALASEFITDAHGNNPLHAAVLAEQPLLIHIILTENPALIDSKNNDGLTPLGLAYSKSLHLSLKAFLDLYYALLAQQKSTNAHTSSQNTSQGWCCIF